MASTETFYREDDGPDKDIVLVHGLSRPGDMPWTEAEDCTPWLRRDLFERSNARVISFKYDVDSGEGEAVYTQAGLGIAARQLLENIASLRETEVLYRLGKQC
ncbi:hypothetical protein CH063_03155 [Colletotrichum higginsianum]|uniref:Uncharacterized protein n=2 Tax=Colletotrichum higginsianum TaxID=80884 RepID=H1VU58_COLHI|nr:hypothetical protein CH35J_003017 [Colletotrichum higginsianum]CCF43766.1 hypothetical protein CH063_03155 [Colletotrichum higginsianum]